VDLIYVKVQQRWKSEKGDKNILYTHREPSKYELLVTAYEEFVEELKEGYDMSIYEYTNDMSIRQCLEENRKELKEQVIWQRIELADIRLKELLKPTKCCIHGSYPIEYFWYRLKTNRVIKVDG